MRVSVTKIGLLSGFLFFAHAMVPFSHAWPLVWPLLGGIAAASVVARRKGVPTFWSGLSASAKAGAAAAVVFFATTVAALSALTRSDFAPVARALGADADVTVSANVLLSLGMAALLGMALAIVSGALAYPLVRPRPS